jgi:hypothetical protein
MRKFLVAAVVSVAMLPGIMPAHAGNSEEVIIGIIGGALGGLIIGEALGNRHVHTTPPASVYRVYEEDYYPGAPVRCVYKKKRIYDPEFDEFILVKKRVCYR